MKFKIVFFNISLALISFGLSLLFISCGEVELISSWKQQDILIDGSEDDWANKLTVFEKEKFSIGIQNDEKYLYLILVSSDRSLQRRISGMGMTVWFDPSGGDNKKIGIRYPIGFREMRPDFNQGEPQREFDPERFREQNQRNLTEAEILLDGASSGERFSVTDAKAIPIRIGRTLEKFVYELRVPLTANEEFAHTIWSNKNSPLGIGIETGEINMEEFRQQMGGMRGGPRGGMRQRGG
ncbi:MAG: hypothetical protein N3A61_03805, partial [Ignavibacteria bacterium]|nr:hypothetical protein [Ignavibacteria bacterium]